MHESILRPSSLAPLLCLKPEVPSSTHEVPKHSPSSSFLHGETSHVWSSSDLERCVATIRWPRESTAPSWGSPGVALGGER